MDPEMNLYMKIRHLLSVEWLVIRKYTPFGVLSIMFMALLPLMNILIAKGILRVGGGDINILSNAYSFSHVWGNVSYWASILVIFLTILIIILTTNDFQNRTHRQRVIEGWLKKDYYHAKCLIVFIGSILTTCYVMFCGLALGMLYGAMSNFPGNMYKLIYFWIYTLNYFGFAMLLSIFLKRSGLAIGVFIFYVFIIETIAVNLLNWQTKTKMGSFLPLESSDSLLPFPLNALVKEVLQQTNEPAEWTYVLASLIWVLLYYIIGRRKLLRSDW